jgi:cytochrome P450
LPHSLVFGHLKIFDDFRKTHPPDISIYVLHDWLHDKAKEFFPAEGKVPPVVYMDLWPFSPCFALVFDPVAASQFTQVRSLPKMALILEFLDPLTRGLDVVSMNGQLWKTWRSRFNPGFSSRNVNTLLPELIEEVVVFTNLLKARAGENGSWGKVFQLEEKTTNLTFDVIVRAAL